MKQGWECPKCGRVYAPTMMQCHACNNKVAASQPSPYVSDDGTGTPLPPNDYGLQPVYN